MDKYRKIVNEVLNERKDEFLKDAEKRRINYRNEWDTPIAVQHALEDALILFLENVLTDILHGGILPTDECD